MVIYNSLNLIYNNKKIKIMNYIKLFEDFTNESLFKGIKNTFKSHLSIIEDMLDERQKKYKSNRVVITYDYFYNEHTDSRLIFPNTDYDKLRKQVDKLKKQLEDRGYQVELDKKYGLQLTVTKIL